MSQFFPSIVSKFAKDLLNQPKIHSGWIKNADAEITLQYDVSERSNVLCLMVVLVKKTKKNRWACGSVFDFGGESRWHILNEVFYFPSISQREISGVVLRSLVVLYLSLSCS